MKRLSLLSVLLLTFSVFTYADTVHVSVETSFFNPVSFNIEVGDTVIWTLVNGSHTTTSTSVPAGAPTWNYTFTGPGDTYEYVVQVPGVYEYMCNIHGQMMRGSFSTPVDLPLVEDFDFAAPDNLSLHGWVIHSGGTTNAISTVTPGLTYPGFPSSGVGNAASLTTSGQDVNRQFEEVTSGTVYASLMVNVSSAQANGDYFFHLGLASTTSIFYGRVFVKLAANGNLAFGLSKTSVSGAIQPVYSDSIYTTGTTYLLVLKYQFNPDVNDDVVSLFINPAISPTEPTPDLTHNQSANNDPVNIGGVYLRQGSGANAANVIVDGINVGPTWVSVGLPVELTSFSAASQNNGVMLNWTTATEINNSGFEVERKQGNNSWNKIAFVNGNGTSTYERKYTYFDENLTSGKYSYRLKQIDFDGSFEYSKVVEVKFETPTQFDLAQNYPNPFNPATTISFSLPKAEHVSLKVYNALGQEVSTIVNGVKEAGFHTVNFNAVNLNSGIYFYKIETTGFTDVKKMTLIK
jgi:plastocyanin